MRLTAIVTETNKTPMAELLNLLRVQVGAMKLSIFLIFLAFVNPSHQHRKVTSLKCNTTGQTVINVVCKIQTINRTHLVIHLGGEIIKIVPDYFVSIKARSKAADS
jgi:hypothetical protein